MAFPLRPAHYTNPKSAVARTHKDPLLLPLVESPFTSFTSEAAPLSFASLVPEEMSLISSTHGKLTRMLLTAPRSVFESSAYGDAYKNLFQHLPEHTALDIVVNEQNKEALRALLTSAGRHGGFTIYPFGDEVRFTVWAEDAYVTAVAGDGSTYFIEPFEFGRAADSVIADFVSHASDLKNTAAPLYFQGGNVLVGDDFFLIGADYPTNTMTNGLIRFPPSTTTPQQEMEFLKQVYSKYLDPGRKVFFPGTVNRVPSIAPRLTEDNGVFFAEIINRGTGKRQPIFHIDMFISLVGRTQEGYEVLVGDPRMAENILGISYGTLGLTRFFNQVALQLTQQGFKVTRNPLPLAHYDFTRPDGSPLPLGELDEVITRYYSKKTADDFITAIRDQGGNSGVLREWYFATSNNCIVENYDNNKTVWLPQYGFDTFAELQATDDANQKIWEDRGYTVKGLGDFHPFTHNLGAAHCITKYLGRA